MDVLNHASANDLTFIIANRKPQLWVHGHIRRHADHLLGETRILFNPLGREGECSGICWSRIIDVWVLPGLNVLETPESLAGQLQ